MKSMSGEKRREMVESRTLTSVKEGSVLVCLNKGEKQENGVLQVVSVDIWDEGSSAEHNIRILLPLRLSGTSKPFSKGDIIVFLGKVYPESMANNGPKNWCWDTHVLTASSITKANQQAAELSKVGLDGLKKRFERGGLDQFKAGTILTLLSVKTLANSDTGDEYALVRYSTEVENTDGEWEQKNGEVTMPGRFLDRLRKPGGLPCNILYEGKKKSAKGGREFHDVHFIDGKDPRVSALFSVSN